MLLVSALLLLVSLLGEYAGRLGLLLRGGPAVRIAEKINLK